MEIRRVATRWQYPTAQQLINPEGEPPGGRDARRHASLLRRLAVVALALELIMVASCAAHQQGSRQPQDHITLFALAPDVEIGGLSVGPDGNIWFTEPLQSRIVRMTPSGQMTEFGVPNSVPYQITAGPEGALWFIDANGPRLGRTTPQGATSFYSLPEDRLSGIGALAVGSDGNLWYTDGKHVGRVSPAGSVTIFPFPEDFPAIEGIPTSLIAGPDGNLWALAMSDQTLWRVTPAGLVTSVLFSMMSVCCLAAGPDHTIWVLGGGEAVSLSASGERAHDLTLASKDTPLSSTFGPDGALWFSEAVRQGDGPEQMVIDRLTLNGALSEFSVPSYSSMKPGSPLGPGLGTPSIVAAPGGAIWFVDHNAIGSLSLT